MIEQARNVCQTTIVRDAGARGQPLAVHGWIYSLRDGLIRDLGFTAGASDEVVRIQRALGPISSCRAESACRSLCPPSTFNTSPLT